VVWLTAEQGGRRSGPPESDYAATGFVPPRSADDGLASFVLARFDATAWISDAVGWWLIVENEADQAVVPGSVVIVTEGAHPVAYFHVQDVETSA
jgi:hypothetical protein